MYGYATSSVAKGPEAAEDLFNEMSMDERGKFEEETLVNVNSRKKAVAAKGETAEGINEYILVTIIAACDGGLKLPPVQDGTELRTALKRVGAIRADALQAVEVLWTPQEVAPLTCWRIRPPPVPVLLRRLFVMHRLKVLLCGPFGLRAPVQWTVQGRLARRRHCWQRPHFLEQGVMSAFSISLQ